MQLSEAVKRYPSFKVTSHLYLNFQSTTSANNGKKKRTTIYFEWKLCYFNYTRFFGKYNWLISVKCFQH